MSYTAVIVEPRCHPALELVLLHLFSFTPFYILNADPKGSASLNVIR